LAVPANVAVSMTGVGLEAAHLKAAAFWGSAGGGGNADKVARAATAAASRVGANGAQGQNARHENSGKRSFDRWTHDNISFSVLQICRNCRLNCLCGNADPTVACETIIAKQVARLGIVTFELLLHSSLGLFQKSTT
jgi:hypothetical protein